MKPERTDEMKLEEKLGRLTSYCLERDPAPLSFANDEERWALYRQMVRSRHLGAISATYKRTLKLLGQSAFETRVASFLDSKAITTRYFWKVPLAFYENSLRDLADPSARELAEYEMLRWKIRNEEAPRTLQPAALDFERRPLFRRPFALFFAEHRVDFEGEERVLDPSRILLYRHAEERLKTLRLRERGARLLSALTSSTKSLKETIAELSTREGFAIDAPYLEWLSTFLATLIEEGFLLGSHPPDASIDLLE